MESEILRHRAEELLKKKPPRQVSRLSGAEIEKLIYDIDLRQTELELQNEELRHLWAKTEVINDKYTGIYDFTPTGYFMLSHEGKIIELNLSGANMLGNDRMRLKNSRFSYFIADETKPIFNLFLGTVFSGREKESCEVVLSLNENTQMFVHLTGIAPGNGKQCLVTMIDISERKRAEEALREREERYRIITDQSPVAIEFYNPEGLLVSMNPACMELFGIFDTEEIYRLSLFNDPNIPDENKNDLRQGKNVHYQAVFDFDKVRELNTYQTSKSGKIWLDILISITKDSSNARNGYLFQIQDITERKLAEDMLQQTRDNYETFFNTIDDFLFVLDTQGNIIHTNNTVTGRLGYTREELLGKPVLMVHPPERREEAARIVGEMLNGSTAFCPVPVLTKSGVSIPVETRVSHGFWDGNPVIFGVTKDISKVQLSEEKFSKLFHINPSACGLSDMENHQYIEVNEAFYKLFGFEKNEVIGKTVMELGILPVEAIETILREADSNGNVIEAAADLRAKNGEIKHVLLSSENIFIQERKYRYTAVHDITERRKSEVSLRESEDKYRSLIQYSSDPIFSFNPDETYKFVNEAFARVFGFKPEELSGKSPHFIFSYDEAERRLGAVRQVFKSGQKGEIEVKVVPKSGNDLYFLTMLDPVKNESGEVLFVTCISKDITERKLAENEIRKLNETLEQRVAERTCQLEAANRDLAIHAGEIGQFSYIASHDLQEPLRTLTNFTQLLREEYSGKLEDEGNRYIDFISASANKMHELVKGLLEYSLLGKERVMTMVDCNQVVAEVLADMADSICVSQADITVQELPVLTGYATELRLLFQNLIDNAVKFRKKELGTEIKISAESRENEWIVKIADNGIGIDEKNREKIFILFKRMHNRNEYAGTGIGLSLCKKIVELHGGTIWVESTSGEGSTFIFSIPKR
ncbi:MAG: PAS domain S-box protein [Bacteroidetes bacterium]|nr:PAS domain S-box protein [Bacteroidota bacterium]